MSDGVPVSGFRSVGIFVKEEGHYVGNTQPHDQVDITDFGSRSSALTSFIPHLRIAPAWWREKHVNEDVRNTSRRRGCSRDSFRALWSG